MKEKTSGEQPIITPEMLRDGTVLCGLIVRFINNRSNENMMAVLSCLRDSNVFVPCTVNEGGSSVEAMADNPVIFPAMQRLEIKPQLYRAKDGNAYLPFYSRRENARRQYLQGASLVNMPYLKAVEMLSSIEMCSRFVVDPHLYNVTLDEDLIKISTELPSRLSGVESDG